MIQPASARQPAIGEQTPSAPVRPAHGETEQPLPGRHADGPFTKVLHVAGETSAATPLPGETRLTSAADPVEPEPAQPEDRVPQLARPSLFPTGHPAQPTQQNLTAINQPESPNADPFGEAQPRRPDLFARPQQDGGVPISMQEPQLQPDPMVELEPVLPPLSEVLPYYDYSPTLLDGETDPDCGYFCPCPEGVDCKTPSADRTCLCPDWHWPKSEYEPRNFAQMAFEWEASNIDYRPLYFEDAPLERYGHTYGCLIQPFSSVGRFGLQLVGLPYQATIDPYWKKIYPLGYYRPGEWAPKLCYQIPLNVDAAAVQAAVTAGMIWIFP